MTWVTVDAGMWLGHLAYLEIADGAAVNFSGTTSALDDGLGYIAVDEIRFSNRNEPSPQMGNGSSEAVVDLNAVVGALWKNRPDLADRLAATVGLARAIEPQIPAPTLGLAIADGTGVNEHIHVRGSHKTLGEVTPRRFLEVLGGSETSIATAGSGRLELAERMVDPAANPLLPRVLVNRLWKHHFGEGLVKSTDDFGAMGRAPTHSELLDWLAAELVDRGWSIKALHRLICTSSTYRMSSVPAGESERRDPTNVYLHRMNVRRLEAEAIRDTLLAVSGRLNPVLYGPSVPVHLTSFMDGRGRPGRSGPLDGDGRRGVYLNVRRNFLNPMMLAFDAPVPFSTMGRRNVSNVPAQALTLLNDPFVAACARLWAAHVLAGPERSAQSRLDELYLRAFCRRPTAAESLASLAFLSGSPPSAAASTGRKPQSTLETWADFCHVLINMKEFIFVN